MVDLNELKLVPENIEVADDTAYVDATDFHLRHPRAFTN